MTRSLLTDRANHCIMNQTEIRQENLVGIFQRLRPSMVEGTLISFLSIAFTLKTKTAHIMTKIRSRWHSAPDLVVICETHYAQRLHTSEIHFICVSFIYSQDFHRLRNGTRE